MRTAIPVAALVWAMGCGTGDDRNKTGNADAAGDPETTLPAPDAVGSPDAGSSDVRAPDATGSGAQCVSGTLPAGAPSFGITIRTSADATGRLPAQRSVDGFVSVERAVSGELDLVADSGARIALKIWSGHVPVESLAVGTRLWVSAYSTEDRPNPYAYVSSAKFTLRTSEKGPVLMAALAGTTAQGADFIGVPLSVESLCTVESPTGGSAFDTGRPCSSKTERFEIAVEADAPVRIKPGTMVSTTIGGALYDLVLSSAEQTTYSESGCQPADWVSSLNLGFRMVARDWSGMVANLPVFTPAQLPACRLGVDAAPVVVAVEGLDWNAIAVSSGGFESAMKVTGTDGNVVTFALSSFGTLTAAARSAQETAVLARGRWFSMIDYQYVIREVEGGPALASVFQGRFSRLVPFASNPDVLGLTLAFKPRCDWIAASCSESGKVMASSLYNVQYGDGADQWVPSQQKLAITVGGRSFDAWVAVTPGCQADPSANAAFLATD